MRQTLVALITVVATLFTTPTATRASTPLSDGEARQAAEERVHLEVAEGHAPTWQGAVLGDAITLYDLSGAVSGYQFAAFRGQESVGYLTVAAAAVVNPVLEFATEGPAPLSSGMSAALQRAKAEGYELRVERPLYLGLLSYAVELAPRVGGRRILDLATGRIVEVDLQQAVPQLIDLAIASGDAEPDVSVPQAYKLIAGVPDWSQFWGGYGCWSGCSPTSAVNVMGYWDGKGHSQLIGGGDWQSAVNEMRTHMDTFCDGNQGSTFVDRISPGMVSYSQARDYRFESQL
jgi:hypothetical protein